MGSNRSSSGERKLILLSTTFDVLSEKPLETAEFGEGMESTSLESPTDVAQMRLSMSDGDPNKPNFTVRSERLQHRLNHFPK